MRTLILATGLAALAAVPAFAQTGSARVSTGASATSTAAGATPSTTTTTTSGTTDASANNGSSSLRPGGPFFNDSGNSAAGPSGIGPDGTATPIGIAALVPEGTVSVTNIGGAAVQQPATATAPRTSTPLFDQVAREGQAKEARRRARGEEPRIIGIAPRTDADLSHQMPDDRIIRY